MQSLIRVIAIAYLIFITILLLTSDPSRIVAVNGWLLRALAPWAHLLSFVTLSILALSASWPAPRWCVVLFLIVYATLTELAQSLVPNRAVEWKDWFMNLAGIAVATAFCWAAASVAGAVSARRRGRCSAVPNDEWEIMHKAMIRPNALQRSWWR